MTIRIAATIAALAALATGAIAPVASGEARPKQKTIRGIDVSRFQGQISWRQVARTRTRFAFVQASRGSGGDCLVVPEECGVDAYFERNMRNARAQGIRVGAYHRAFASGRTVEGAQDDARQEADLFIETVGRLRGRDLLPALDVETPFVDLDEEELQVWIATWSRRVERELGYRPIIYTNQSSWLETGDTTRFALAGHPLWVANFDVRRPQVPADNWAAQGWSIWQFTSTGHVRGVRGVVDKNRLAKGFGRISVAGY